MQIGSVHMLVKGKYINNDTPIELLDLEKNIVFLRSPKVIIKNKYHNKKVL